MSTWDLHGYFDYEASNHLLFCKMIYIRCIYINALHFLLNHPQEQQPHIHLEQSFFLLTENVLIAGDGEVILAFLPDSHTGHRYI